MTNPSRSGLHETRSSPNPLESFLDPANDFVLNPLDFFAVEFDQRAAAGADQVVVVGMLVFVLVEGTPVVKLELAGEPAVF